MVGLGRFELPTSCTPSKRASQAALQPETSLVYTVSEFVSQFRDTGPQFGKLAH